MINESSIACIVVETVALVYMIKSFLEHSRPQRFYFNAPNPSRLPLCEPCDELMKCIADSLTTSKHIDPKVGIGTFRCPKCKKLETYSYTYDTEMHGFDC